MAKLAFKLQGHTEFQGLRLAIENRKGSVRSGTDKDGKPWRTKMVHPYGYIKGTKGSDGEEVDMYLGPKPDATHAFVVHQNKDDGKTYDEDKVMLGFGSKEEATKAYLKHYNDPKFLGPVKEVPMQRIEALVGAAKPTIKISRIATFADLEPYRAAGERQLAEAKTAMNDRAHNIVDRLDDAGLAVLASPYVAKALGSSLAHRAGALGAVGRAANAYHHGFEAHPMAEVGGLALVAPGVTHGLAKGIERATAKKDKVAEYHEAQKMAFVSALRSMAAPLAAGAKNLVQRGGKAMGLVAPAAPAVASAPAGAKKLFNAGNIAKGGLVAGAGMAVYGGKKAIDTASSLLTSPTESMAPAQYQAPRVL